MRILLIVYDNDSYIHFFPQGIAYIAAALKKEGHEVEIYQQDIHHWPDNHLTSFLDKSIFDLVGLGFVAGYYQFRKAKTISEAVNRSKNRKNFIYVLGGHGPSAEPEYFRKEMEADTIVVGEGEKTIFEIIKYPNLLGNHCLIRKEPIKDVDSIPWPAYDMFPIEIYRLMRWPLTKRTEFTMPILTGRGCPYRCNFCYRMDPGFRPRSPESVIEEMIYLHKTWGITHFQFSDELFMSSELRPLEFCIELIGGQQFSWDCNGRLNFATKEVLDVMKAAGCRYINYGIEALDDEVLEKMNKNLTVDQIYQGVENTIKAGIYPGLNIMWGNIGDDFETLEKGLDFLLRYNGTAELRTIRPVTPYPGSPLYFEAIERGLLRGPAEFYETHHVNSDLLTINFTDLSDDQFHEALGKANDELIAAYHMNKRKDALYHARNFYQTKDANFRGFRAV